MKDYKSSKSEVTSMKKPATPKSNGIFTLGNVGAPSREFVWKSVKPNHGTRSGGKSD